MKFYAVAYQFQEDVFFDFEKGEDRLGLELPTCLLPTKEMADQFIEDELSTDYVSVSVELDTYTNGVASYIMGTVERWEDE